MAAPQPRVITFHYVLTDSKGTRIDSSRDRNDPMIFMEGSGVIIPGLENSLKLLGKGDTRKVTIAAADAYGQHDKELIMDVSRDRFPPNAKIAVGDRFRAGAEQEHGPVFSVTKATETHVTVDGNHPLAGMELTFEVEILDVRDPTKEELEHGHAHGPGGHSH